MEDLFKPDAGMVLWNSYTHSNLIKTGQPLAFDHWALKEFDHTPVNQGEAWNSLDADDNAKGQWVKAYGSDGASSEAQHLVVEAHHKADQIDLEARRKAEQLIAETEARVQQAEEEGFQRGWDAAREEVRPLLELVKSMAGQVDQWQRQLSAQAENFISDMVFEIARSMFGEGVVLNDRALQANLTRVLENTHALGDLKIFLNPQDAAVLDTSWREAQSAITGNRVQIISAEGITRGGCFVQGALGTVDARVETQLETILGSLKNTEERE